MEPPSAARASRPRAPDRNTGGMGVRPAPVLTVIARVLPLWAAWLVVVVLGRRVCLIAQRIPPVVHLVRRARQAAASRS